MQIAYSTNDVGLSSLVVDLEKQKRIAMIWWRTSAIYKQLKIDSSLPSEAFIVVTHVNVFGVVCGRV